MAYGCIKLIKTLNTPTFKKTCLDKILNLDNHLEKYNPPPLPEWKKIIVLFPSKNDNVIRMKVRILNPFYMYFVL